MKNKIKVVGFDADDTLWVNEPFFRETEHKFCQLFTDKFSEKEITDILLGIEIANLPKYGYGTRGFMLSMIETAQKITGDKITPGQVNYILKIGNELLIRERAVLAGVKETLEALKSKYKLILITKGDLLEQEQKIELSGLGSYFDFAQILSEKKESNYQVLFNYYGIAPSEFVMVGNSLKSDIQPILKLGGYGVYIPFEITWEHEKMNIDEVKTDKFVQLENITQLVDLLA